MNDDQRWVAGVDGCKSRWAVAWMVPGDQSVRLDRVDSFAQVLTMTNGPGVIAVDMPIGLSERGEKGGRAAERAVREKIGARRSSVFAVASRAAMMEVDYDGARRVALATSDPPRSMSKQTFCIGRYIREIDALLRADPRLAEQVYETHPEAAFWRMNGERPLEHPKKKKHRICLEGMDERRALLLPAGIPRDALDRPVVKGIGDDDRLDALAALVVARRIRDGMARPFPATPPCDQHGLKMAIWV